MKKPLLSKSFHRLFILAIITVLVIICGSFSVKRSICSRLDEQFQPCDTIPYISPRSFKWPAIPQLIPFDGELIAFNGKDSLLIKRSEYETYAREHQGKNRNDEIFTRVEIEAEYPGGPKAWSDYVSKKIIYPKVAQRNHLQGTVIVQFVVDTDGKKRDVAAIAGPIGGGLREEAIILVKGSGYWHPGIQNSRLVTSYKRQPVAFIIK